MNPYAEVDEAIAECVAANGSTLFSEWAGKPARFFHLPGLCPFEGFLISISPPSDGRVEVRARSIDTDDGSEFEKRFEGPTRDIEGLLSDATALVSMWRNRPVLRPSEPEPPRSNWGGFIAVLLATPLMLLIAFGALISGGGCEGRELPCKSDFTPMWIAFAVVVLSAFALDG